MGPPKTIKQRSSRNKRAASLQISQNVVLKSATHWFFFVGFVALLCSEKFLSQVEILFYFVYLLKSYLLEISMSSTSHVKVKTRLLPLSEAFWKFLRLTAVDLIRQMHQKNNFCNFLTLKTRRPF